MSVTCIEICLNKKIWLECFVRNNAHTPCIDAFAQNVLGAHFKETKIFFSDKPGKNQEHFRKP